MTIRGRVLGADGKPKAGATLLVLDDDKASEVGRADADGHFSVTVPKKRNAHLIAQAEGTGIDFLEIGPFDPAAPVELRLVKDRPLHGQIVNTEGKPIAGVQVVVVDISVYAHNSLDSFLAVWMKQQNTGSGLPRGEKRLWRRMGKLLATTTNAEGRFSLPHVGEERVVALRLSGGGIADAQVWIVNRPGFDPKPYNEAVINNSDPRAIKFFGINWRLYGPDLSYVAEAGKIIRGVVKDADSGKGRPGVRVRLTRQDNGFLVRTIPEVRTDAQGRYEIRGAHKAKRYMLEVTADTAAGYMPCQVWAEDTSGYDPITTDIAVKKGVIVTGKVIDRANGQAVPGWVMTDFLTGNPFVKDYPLSGPSAFAPAGESTGEDGIFRVVTIPGPVLLMGGRGPDTEYKRGGNIETMQYKQPSADEKYPQYFRKKTDRAEYHSYLGTSRISGNFCKVLEIKPGTPVVHQDIFLERASALPLKIQDAEGRSLTGVWGTGLIPENWHAPVLLSDEGGSVFDVESGKPRLLILYQPARKLVGTRTLTGMEKPPVVVKLGPGGAVTGRLVDGDGKPMAGVVVDLRFKDREGEEVHAVLHRSKRIVTDAAGAFTLDEVIPDLKFELVFRRGKQRFERTAKSDKAMMHVRSGETRDAGTIALQRSAERTGE